MLLRFAGPILTIALLTGFSAMTSAQVATKPAPFALPELPSESVTSFKLPNGLEVVVIPDSRVPVVTHMIWYRVGSADEPRGKSGIAHFLEHLMFKGTKAHNAGVFSKAVAAWGGQENAFTSTDYTAYFQRVARDRLPEMMAFEADRMTGLTLSEDLVNPERDVVLEERRQRTDNEPSARLSEQIGAALFLNHPYGIPIIGWEHEIRGLTREDAISFYRAHYAPNNAVLVIAGDITVDEVKTLVDATYAKVPANASIQPRVRPQDPPPAAERRVTLADPRVAQPSMSRTYLVPSYRTAKKGEAEALDLMAFLLGNGSSSHLFKTLVTEQGLATSAGAYYQGSSIDPTRFAVYATPRPNVTLADLETAIDKALAVFLTKPIDEGELRRAKTRFVAESIYSQDSQQTLARMYGAALVTGSSIEDVREWPKRIAAVTPEEILSAAKTYLDRRRSVTGFLIKEQKP